LREELRQEINQMTQWRLALSDRYIHVATDTVFKGHPLREEVLELIQQSIEFLEVGIKTRRDKLTEIN
jgi:hypothetical protein